jgi:hypothetical protein
LTCACEALLEADALGICLRAECCVGETMAAGNDDWAAEGGYRRNDGLSQNPSSKLTLAEPASTRTLLPRPNSGRAIIGNVVAALGGR